MSYSVASYAYGAGLLAAFNPCGFVLLPTYAAGFVASDHHGGPRAAMMVATRLTAGFLAVFAAVGVVVGLLGASTSSVTAATSWVSIAAGAVFVAVGLALVANRKIPGLSMQVGSTSTAFTYGVGYAVASLACALPVFLSAVVYAIERGGFFDGLIAGAAYSIGMGTVATAVVFLAAGARIGVLNRMRALVRFFNPAAGVLMIVAGLVLVVRRWVDVPYLEQLSATVVDAVDGARWVPVFAAVAAAALAAAVWRVRRTTTDTESESHLSKGDTQ